MKAWILIAMSVIFFGLFFLSPQTSHSFDVGQMADGVLVPLAFFSNELGQDTAVGVTCLETSGFLYWTFFSANGAILETGSTSVTGKRFIALSLAAMAPRRPDMTGYLVVTYDNDGTLLPEEERKAISANAVLISISEGDAAFIPCIPLSREDYLAEPIDLANLTSSSLGSLANGTPAESIDYARYWVDPMFSAQTQLVIWTLDSAVGGGDAIIDDGKTGEASVILNLTNSRVNRIDAETLGNRPAKYVEGTVAISALNTPHIIFSIITSPVIGAAQTLIASVLEEN